MCKLNGSVKHIYLLTDRFEDKDSLIYKVKDKEYVLEKSDYTM